MGDLNEFCKHDTLAAYCGDCMIELRAELAAVKQVRDALKLALETENAAATRYATQVAHWIEKHDTVKQQRDGLVAALNESSGILEAFKFQSQTAMQQIEINEAALAKVKN